MSPGRNETGLNCRTRSRSSESEQSLNNCTCAKLSDVSVADVYYSFQAIFFTYDWLKFSKIWLDWICVACAMERLVLAVIVLTLLSVVMCTARATSRFMLYGSESKILASSVQNKDLPLIQN